MRRRPALAAFTAGPVTVAVAVTVVVVSATAGCIGGNDGGIDAGPVVTRTTVAVDPAADPLGGFDPSPLAWEPCTQVLECATLTVPLDWEVLDGETIDLAVTRVPADDPDSLAGAIVVNPGGPGASGNEFIAGGGPLTDQLRARFDTMSWDPRGIGGSASLGCDGQEVAEFVALDSDPDDAAEQSDLEDAATAVGAACDDAAGALLPFVGTGSTAKDLEAIRRAYGGPVGYLGFSYGTAIGLQHLDLFPGTLVGVVLDGVVDAALPLTELLRAQTVAIDEVMDEVLAGCPDGEGGCPEGGAAAAYDELAVTLESSPLPAGPAELGPGDLAAAAIYVTYDAADWPSFHAGLIDAQAGDGRLLRTLTDQYRTSASFGLYQAVSCLDSEHPTGAAAWARFAEELESLSPRFGAAVANEMLPCATWPAAPVPVTGSVAAGGSGPVLVLGGTGDAATPLALAEAVADSLAEATLVIREGDGHTSYLRSSCVQDLVAAYFLNDVVPADGTRC